jgi:hypothetical protein
MKRFVNLAAIAMVILGCVSVSHATVFIYSNDLDGGDEAPPNNSAGTGFTTVTYNDVARTLRVEATFSGLTGNTTAAHIHATTAIPFAGTAGVATQVPSFAGFPLGVTSGAYDMTFDLTLASSWNPTFITNNGGSPATAEAALAAALAQGRAYLNIHSNVFPGGEIRGFLPEPASLALLAIGALLIRRRR